MPLFISELRCRIVDAGLGLALLACAVAANGCTRSNTGPDDVAAGEPAQQRADVGDADAIDLHASAPSPDSIPDVQFASSKVTLREADWDGVQEIVASHRGRVVVVNVWTSTCLGCIAEFPHFAALQQKFGDDVACVSVNCDYDGVEGKPLAYYRDNVLAFLERQDAEFDNVQLTVPFLDFLQQIDLGATPALFVHDRAGKLAAQFDNADAAGIEEEYTMEEVERTIARLIGPESE